VTRDEAWDMRNSLSQHSL